MGSYLIIDKPDLASHCLSNFRDKIKFKLRYFRKQSEL